MTRIGLISDTHNYLDPTIFEHFKKCDEIWHAGDFGTIEIASELQRCLATQSGLTPKHRHQTTQSGLTPKHRHQTNQGGLTPKLRGVYGNIDNNDIRNVYPEQLVFMCEEVKVMMRHIGGYPPKYNPETKKEILIHKPQLFISGHSHILKIMYDDKLNCLHINPGAAGKHGWQKVRTLVRFSINAKDIKDCEVIELI